MDYDELDEKKRKAVRWVELAVYVIVALTVAAKVLPVFWRILTANL